MTEQYYYYFLWLLRELIQTFKVMLGLGWYWWVQKVTFYPELSVVIILFCILFLIAFSIKRRARVVVIEGDEIKNLIKAIYKKEK